MLEDLYIKNNMYCTVRGRCTVLYVVDEKLTLKISSQKTQQHASVAGKDGHTRGAVILIQSHSLKSF